MKRIASLALTLGAVALAAGPGYKVLTTLKVGGSGGWDYVAVDSAQGRLYASHTNQVDVIDLSTGMPVGKIEDTQGVHGIAIASDLGKGFISAGRANSVVVFDPKTLATTGKIDAGKNPDAILYEPVSKRVYAFNGSSKDFTAIDAKTNAVAATVGVGGKPEFAQADGKGKIYVNIEDTGELIEIDAAKATITKRIKLEGCEDPSGLAIDPKARHLFSVCGNRVMTVTDPDAGKILATLPIGAGADGVAFDNGMAFSSNGRDGNITVVGMDKGKYAVLETVPTGFGARTIGADSKTHKLYLPTADYGPEEAAKDGGKRPRRPLLPDSFHLIVVGK